MSYMGLRRRTRFARPWLVNDKFPEHQRVFLDSGAYTLNSSDDHGLSWDELDSIARHYFAFVMANLGRLTMVSEFDALALGRDWIEHARVEFWDPNVPTNMFLPIWHPEYGLDELDNLARNYRRVGVLESAFGGRDLAPTLNGIVAAHGTSLHGVAMTKPEPMRQIRWDSVASTSWLSPAKWGDTILWTGRELKRYPRDLQGAGPQTPPYLPHRQGIRRGQDRGRRLHRTAAAVHLVLATPGRTPRTPPPHRQRSNSGDRHP